MSNPRYWRIRMKYGGYEELARQAWERDEVGIWYGGWSADDLKAALRADNTEKVLTKANKSCGLEWEVGSYTNTARRFANIDSHDWVVVYFDGTLGLAHLHNEAHSTRNHPLNRGKELFKYRKISEKKEFSLNRLPDAFRVLSFAGQGNVFEPRGAADLAALLGAARTESDVTKALQAKSLEASLELLGPESWESVCQAYLIIEHQFVPTGLATGRTLPNVDIVGRRSSDGIRILAQCKKDPHEGCICEKFHEAIADLSKGDLAFYFAFGGCSGKIPQRIRVVDREVIRDWSKTKKGKQYFDWLFGG